MFSQLNIKRIHHVENYDKSSVFSLGLITLSIIYEVFKVKINTPEFKNQLDEEDLQNLILDIEFDVIYNKEAGIVDSEYLGIFVISVQPNNRACRGQPRQFQRLFRSHQAHQANAHEEP